MTWPQISGSIRETESLCRVAGQTIFLLSVCQTSYMSDGEWFISNSTEKGNGKGDSHWVAQTQEFWTMKEPNKQDNSSCKSFLHWCKTPKHRICKPLFLHCFSSTHTLLDAPFPPYQLRVRLQNWCNLKTFVWCKLGKKLFVVGETQLEFGNCSFASHLCNNCSWMLFKNVLFYSVHD